MNRPLEGIRVLDFGMAAFGPLSATYLGVLGADTIKIEQPTGDVVRRGGGIENPYLGTRFSLAVVSTEYAAAHDRPLAGSGGAVDEKPTNA